MNIRCSTCGGCGRLIQQVPPPARHAPCDACNGLGLTRDFVIAVKRVMEAPREPNQGRAMRHPLDTWVEDSEC